MQRYGQSQPLDWRSLMTVAARRMNRNWDVQRSEVDRHGGYFFLCGPGAFALSAQVQFAFLFGRAFDLAFVAHDAIRARGLETELDHIAFYTAGEFGFA